MIIIDFETNSSNIGDVVEVAIIKVSPTKKDGVFQVIDTFHRYYFSSFATNPYSLDVHGLSPHIIKQKREGVEADYPRLFKNDTDFEKFCIGTNIIVAHNLSFELRHISERILFSRHLCTMKLNKTCVSATGKTGKIKSPSLGETCSFYGISFSETSHHGALYDTERTLDILNSMNRVLFE